MGLQCSQTESPTDTSGLRNDPDDSRKGKGRVDAPVLSVQRPECKGLHVVARNFFLLLLNFSDWTCMAVA